MFAVYFLIGFLAIKLISHIVIKKLHIWAQSTASELDDLFVSGLKKYMVPIAYLLALYFDTKTLTFTPTLSKVIHTTFLMAIMIIGALLLNSILTYMMKRYSETKLSDQSNQHAFHMMTKILKGLIWGIALILFLDNIGVKINSLITGLGIGGIAIAFAAQSVLTDIFCFITIFFDKPFEVGDFIISDTQMGTVEHIGLKTTRLRSLNGELLIFSNTDLTSSRISNYKTMQQRRVLFTLGVTYDTEVAQLKAIPSILKAIIEDIPNVEFGRAHFKSYGPYSLDFEIVYFVLDGDYDLYMDLNQSINLKIKESFDQLGIEFAFPTQTLQVQNVSNATNTIHHP